MSNRRLALVFAVAYVAMLLLIVPAQLLLARVDLPPQVRLGPVDGSLWRGRTRWVEYHGIRTGVVQWRVSPWGLFAAAPLHVNVNDPVSAEAGIGAVDNGVLVADGRVTASIAEILRLVGYPGLGIEAKAGADIDILTWSTAGCGEDTSGVVMLSEWSGDLPGLSSIGPLTANLSCEQGRLVIAVDPQNAVALTGRVVLAADGRYQLDLRMAPPPGELFDTLAQLLGRPRDGRHFVLSQRG